VQPLVLSWRMNGATRCALLLWLESHFTARCVWARVILPGFHGPPSVLTRCASSLFLWCHPTWQTFSLASSAQTMSLIALEERHSCVVLPHGPRHLGYGFRQKTVDETGRVACSAISCEPKVRTGKLGSYSGRLWGN
jgi:hypothetical protein